ncbi:MAG: hypothetical protein IJX11_05780 [Bacteroidales bacterium]|nr:hypothetical protein [Bacteroidales bacterium]
MENLCLTIINSDIVAVKNILLELFSQDDVLYSYGQNRINMSEIQYNPQISKLQIWKPVGFSGTVMWGNMVDGFDTIAHILNRKYKLEWIRVSLSMPSSDGYEMRVFHYMPSNGKDRFIRVMQDPKWEFYEHGEPLPFEYMQKYSERFIKRRLTNEMILDYVRMLGWNLRASEFWISDGDTCYLEWKNY